VALAELNRHIGTEIKVTYKYLIYRYANLQGLGEARSGTHRILTLLTTHSYL
jgi:hypothetical protein